MTRNHLDDAGSAPGLREVRAELQDLPDGNPSSPHSEGRAARAALDRAREAGRTGFWYRRTEVTVVSSGTEAVNLALFGVAGPLLAWAAEHQSVLGAVRRMQAMGRDVVIAPVDRHARVDIDAIKPGIGLVSVGLANNDVGTIQPVAEVIARAHDIVARVHVDACAGPRWVPIPPGADLVSLSGHKLGAGPGGLPFVRVGCRELPILFRGPAGGGRGVTDRNESIPMREGHLPIPTHPQGCRTT